MVEYSHVDQRERVTQRHGDEFVGLARLRNAARMIVRDDDGRRSAPENFLDYLAGMNAVDRRIARYNAPSMVPRNISLDSINR